MQKDKEFAALTAALGYSFRKPELLRQALTHPSMGRKDNQRLEFLGDAVLQFIMSEKLYAEHPSTQEGGLTHMRALLVCEAALSQVASSLHIGEALLMDRGEELTGGRTKPSVLCDAMEAVLAAVYLDGGMDAARGIVLQHWPAAEDIHRPMQDSKGALQEHLQKDGGSTPTYRIIGQTGPDHSPRFEAAVSRDGVQLATGSGKTKKEAEQAAALAALQAMGVSMDR